MNDAKRNAGLRTRRRFAVALTALALIAGLVYIITQRPWERPSVDNVNTIAPTVAVTTKVPLADLPAIDLEAVDPAVVRMIQDARKSVEKSPRSADAWGDFGVALYAHDFNAAAADAFAKAAELAPHEARWHYLQARAMETIDADVAVTLLQKTVAICQDDPEAPALQLSEQLLALNRFDEAKKQLTQFLARHPGHARAQLALGRLEFTAGDLAAARPLLEAATRDPAASKTGNALLSQIALREGKTDAALKYQQLAAQPSTANWPDPWNMEAIDKRTGLKDQLVRADKFFAQGNVDASVAILRVAVAEHPQSDWAHILLARGLVKKRQLAEAKEHLTKALEIAPESVEAQFRLGVALYLEKRPKEAVAWFRKAVALKPDFSMAHYNLAQCLKDLGDNAGAIESFEAAALADPNYFEAHVMLGIMRSQQGDHAEAKLHLERALALRPNDQKIRQQLAKVTAAAQSALQTP